MPPDDPPRRPTPPPLPRQHPRLQSPTERELASEAGRKRRSAPLGVPIVVGEIEGESFEGPITGVLEGEALRAARRERRSTGERVERLEDKHDVVIAKLADHEASIGRVEGKLDGLDGKIDILVGAVERDQELKHVKLSADFDLGKAGALDTIHRGQAWREWITKGLAIAAAVVAAFAAGKC